MNVPTPPPGVFTREWLIRAAGTAAAVTVLSGPAISFMAYYMMDNLVEDAREELGIAAQDARLDALEASLGAALDGINERLEGIDRHLATVSAQAQRALGADGILELQEGTAYIREPVFEGDQTLRLRALARRTDRGANCTAQSRVGVFQDSDGNVYVGEHEGPIRQLGGGGFEPYDFVFRVPPGMTRGRVTVSIETIYDCAGTPVRDVRPPLIFQLRAPGDRSQVFPPGLPMGPPPEPASAD